MMNEYHEQYRSREKFQKRDNRPVETEEHALLRKWGTNIIETAKAIESTFQASLYMNHLRIEFWENLTVDRYYYYLAELLFEIKWRRGEIYKSADFWAGTDNRRVRYPDNRKINFLKVRDKIIGLIRECKALKN